jgi:hypothetical protein
VRVNGFIEVAFVCKVHDDTVWLQRY